MNLVLDTNVWLSATLWNGSVAQKLLAKIIMSDVEIYVSTKIIEEYTKVLKRDFRYTDEQIIEKVNYIKSIAELINPSEVLNIVQDDPTDDRIIECAIESSSKYIITYDKHLLNLKSYQGILIVKPEEARVIF